MVGRSQQALSNVSVCCQCPKRKVERGPRESQALSNKTAGEAILVIRIHDLISLWPPLSGRDQVEMQTAFLEPDPDTEKAMLIFHPDDVTLLDTNLPDRSGKR